jgi:CelD/BcsL family acetyltransferase involved in cellulose biosynthesis
MKVRVLTSLEELEQSRHSWDELADAAGARQFTRWSWCSPLWRHLGRGRLCVIVCEEDGLLVSLAPLHERQLMGLRFTRFLGHGFGTVSEILVAPGHDRAAAYVWDHLLASPNRFVELLEYEAGRGGLAALAMRGDALTRVRGRDRCPVIELSGSADDYLRSRPKSLRRALRVAEQRLAEAGTKHHTEVVTTPERLDAVLPEVVSVYDLAEQATPRQHFLAGPLAAFTRELLHRSAEEARLRLFLSRVDGVPVSFDIAFAAECRLSVWVGRFHPGFAHVSPGHLSQRAIVQRAGCEGLTEIDLLLGDHAYKRRWSTSEYETLEVTAAPSTMSLWAGRAILSMREMARQAPKAFRSAAAGKQHQKGEVPA